MRWTPADGDVATGASTPLLRQAASLPERGSAGGLAASCHDGWNTHDSSPNRAVRCAAQPVHSCSPFSKADLEVALRRRSNDLDGGRHRVPSIQDMELLRGPEAEWHTRLRDSLRRKWERKYSHFGPLDWAGLALPCIRWLRAYQWRACLPADLMAGLSVGIMTVPQSLSYARIAGLPSEFGLHGAFAPVLAYALFGGSRQLAVGPVAITSLLLSNGLAGLIPGADVNLDPNDPVDPGAQRDYNIAAIQVSALVGLMYCALGVARLGFLTNFLSHSVISGFTTGAAIVIGMSQLKLLLGFHVPAHGSCLATAWYLVQHARETVLAELVLGLLWLAVLLTMKHYGKTRTHLKFLRPLGPLTVSALGICAVKLFGLQLRTVGHVPAGLPPLTLAWWWPPGQALGDLALVAATLTVVGLMESIAIAKSLAAAHHYDVDANQELVGLGIANLAGGAFCSYPTTGGFSRSAVNADAGAVSGLAGVVTACFVASVLAFLTRLIQHMPHNALGAIVLSGVAGLLQFGEAAFLWRIAKLDFAVWAVSLLGTVVLGVEAGLAIAIGLALLFVIYESAYPHTAVLGNLPGTRVYRNVRQYPEAAEEAGLLLVRLDAPLYFANVQHVRGRLRKYEARCQEAAAAGGQPRVQFVVVDLSPVPHIDATAVRMIVELASDLQARGLRLAISNPSERVHATFERSGLVDVIGRDFIFVRIHDAVEYCKHLMAAGGALGG